MNFSQYLRYQWNSWNCFSAFLLKFMWFKPNDIAQKFSIFHGLWSPSKDCQHLCPCSSIGFFNITAELFSKGLYSWSPENRFVAPEGAEGPGWETLVKPINCPFCCGLQISLTMQNMFVRGRRELSTGLHLQPEGSRQKKHGHQSLCLEQVACRGW